MDEINLLGQRTSVDVRELPPRQRHPLIFAALDRMVHGETLELVNDHDPKPLYYQISAERSGQFGWEYLQEGPDVWKVQITKLCC